MGSLWFFSNALDISQFVEEAADGDMWPLCDGDVVFGAGKIVPGT